MKVINETKLNQILEFIKKFQLEEGRSPSYRQIAKVVSFPSLATAQKYVKILQNRGLIERNDLGRIVTPTRLNTDDTIVAPLVGKVACGKPILAVENIEGNYKLPKAIFGSQKTMILTASGDSMEGVGIHDGDLIVAAISNTAESGEIVVALIDDSATVKTYYRRNGKHILHAENPKYEDIITKELTIQGVVKHVIHSF
ncbi:MAG: repressor LexA [Clostridia bacterium]|nr:repressor LexA [Clostridia bacterium]